MFDCRRWRQRGDAGTNVGWPHHPHRTGREIGVSRTRRRAYRAAMAVYPCKPMPERGVTLALWLQDPAVANCLDAAIPTQRVADHTKSVTLRAVLAFENGDPYPGGRRITEPLGSPLPLYPGDIANAELPNPPRLMGEVLIGIGPADLATQCYQPPDRPPTTRSSTTASRSYRRIRLSRANRINSRTIISATSARRPRGSIRRTPTRATGSPRRDTPPSWIRSRLRPTATPTDTTPASIPGSVC